MNPSTILEALAIRARDTPHVVAYTVETEAITYGQLLDDAGWVARRLTSAGLSPGDRCALILPTCPDFVRAIFGVQMAGATPVAVDINLPVAGLCRRLRQVQPAVILTTTEQAARFSVTELASLPGLVVTLDWLKTLGPARLSPTRVPQPRDAAYLQFTSGTTGDPRAAIISHRALLASLEGYADRFDHALAGHHGQLAAAAPRGWSRPLRLRSRTIRLRRAPDPTISRTLVPLDRDDVICRRHHHQRAGLRLPCGGSSQSAS